MLKNQISQNIILFILVLILLAVVFFFITVIIVIMTIMTMTIVIMNGNCHYDNNDNCLCCYTPGSVQFPGASNAGRFNTQFPQAC